MKLPIGRPLRCAFALLLLLAGSSSPASAQSVPYGWLDVATDSIISGWAKDDDIHASYNYFSSTCGVTSTGGIVVHAYIWPVDEAGTVTGSPLVVGQMANSCRCDVACHGFGFTVSSLGLAPGRYKTSVYALGVNGALTGGQYGHPGNLDGINAELYGSPKFFEVKSKTLTFPATASSPAFTCDVFASSTKQVLVNDAYSVSYDFNVTQLSASNYLAVFHSERFSLNPSSVCTGDAIAARYAGAPDAHFGSRTGGGGDKIVTTTSGLSTYMWNDPSVPEPQCQSLVSGGGNPILIDTSTPSVPNKWTLLWLSVAQLVPADWRHYLHMAQFDTIANIHGGTWAVLAENGGFPWAVFSGAPVHRAYDPTPARNASTNTHVKSEYAPASGATNGLIGNISRNAALTDAYYFYNEAHEYVPSNPATWCPAEYRFAIENYPSLTPLHCLKTMRRKLTFNDWGNWFDDPVRVMWGWVTKVAYHPGRGRWMVLHGCADGPCIQFTEDNNVLSVRDTHHGGTLVGIYTPGSALDSFKLGYSPLTNSQWGILKNGHGQIASDDFRLYFRPGCEGCNFGGTEIRALRVRCQ